MSELTRTDQAESVCTKRSWVMSTLTDDERIDQEEELPQALRFHLSRCDSCRALADHVQSVTAALAQVAEAEPPDHLLALAQARTRASIDSGAVLTGRVDVFKLEDMNEDEGSPRQVTWRPLRYAAAAIILVGFASIWISSQTQPAQPMVSGPDSWNPAIPAPHEAAEDAASDIRLAARETKVHRTDATPRVVSSGERDKRHRETRLARSTCRHRSLVEAASCDNPNCIHGIRVRPASRQRTLGWEGIFTPRYDGDNATRLLGHDVKPNR